VAWTGVVILEGGVSYKILRRWLVLVGGCFSLACVHTPTVAFSFSPVSKFWSGAGIF
jgi:hypothetical protein